MTLDELIATREPPKSAEDLRRLADEILAATDLSNAERESFSVGYVFGLTYALAADKQDAATELLLRMREMADTP